MTDILTDIDRLAKKIAEEALGNDKSAEERQEAFKLLFPYYALQFKSRGSEPDEGPTFADMTRAFKDGGNGAEVRDRRGTGRGPFDAED